MCLSFCMHSAVPRVAWALAVVACIISSNEICLWGGKRGFWCSIGSVAHAQAGGSCAGSSYERLAELGAPILAVTFMVMDGKKQLSLHWQDVMNSKRHYGVSVVFSNRTFSSYWVLSKTSGRSKTRLHLKWCWEYPEHTKRTDFISAVPKKCLQAQVMTMFVQLKMYVDKWQAKKSHIGTSCSFPHMEYWSCTWGRKIQCASWSQRHEALHQQWLWRSALVQTRLLWAGRRDGVY